MKGILGRKKRQKEKSFEYRKKVKFKKKRNIEQTLLKAMFRHVNFNALQGIQSDNSPSLN